MSQVLVQESNNARLTNRALVLLTIAIQEAEKDKVHGRVGVELDFQGGDIKVVRRVSTATEK